MASAAQIEANRRNARKSTGPRTASGKAVCARNAVKHGFRSRNSVLAEDERNELDRLIALFRNEHQPVNQAEESAVLRLATAVWNLDRIAVLEFAAYQGDAEGPGVIATVRNIHALARYRATAEQSFHTALREILQLRRSRQTERTRAKICTNRPNFAQAPRLTLSRSSEYSCHMRLWRVPFLVALASACAAAEPSVQFETKVKPILVERCVKCHSADTKMNGLDLSTRAALLKGGKHGVDVVPGDAAASRLYQFVSAGRMPPDRKLEPEEIEAVRQWISDGAVWSEAGSIAVERPRAGLDWWALQTPKKHEPPKVAGVTNPIDAFVLEKLYAKGLDFAPPADPRTLLRRISFDLHGLPPKPEDLDEPYEDAIERLLASPHYGERWGRHWLDVVRFGETDGGEHNNERFTAWKYRDYVIDAFNSGKPYNQFLREQIAGDVLAPHDSKIIAATGFLVAGPWDSVTKMLNKDEIMRKTIRQDELDDMVTTAFATFQGLTVNCARCHDHKFDPIPTRDYYRLTAIFNGAGFGERETATAEEKKVREATVAPIKKDLDSIKQQLAALEDQPKTRLLIEKYKALDAATKGDPRRIPVNALWNRNDFQPVTARYFRFAVTSHSGKTARIDELKLLPAGHTVRDWNSPEEASADRPAYVRIDLGEPRTVSEILWSTDRIKGTRDGFIRVYQFESSADGVSWTAVCSSLDHTNVSEIRLPEVSSEELSSVLSPVDSEKRKHLLEERDGIQARLNAVLPLESVHAVKPEALSESFVLDRGSLQRPLEKVAPGALTAIRQLSADLEVPDPAEGGARRLALANWMADERNPLTARVIVNRIWYYHFGRGIVNTPSDFGFNGDRPSHPELLDFLAAEFVENGWSLKWLHQLILTSQTYRQSSAFNQKAHALDADNRLLWRMPLKRMDAETLRDSILQITGNLNPARGGPSFFLHKKAERSYLHKALDNDGPDVWRRAVYRFVVRGGERIFLDSFDCPDPAVATPQRSVSNTPVQALTLMNNKFILKQAGLLAERLEREAGSDPASRISRAYELVFSREPSEGEIGIGRRFLEQRTLALYCRALLNTNEFVYVP